MPRIVTRLAQSFFKRLPSGVRYKAIAKRLGHAHLGFTMHTYQHLLPGMGVELSLPAIPIEPPEPASLTRDCDPTGWHTSPVVRGWRRYPIGESARYQPRRAKDHERCLVDHMAR